MITKKYKIGILGYSGMTGTCLLKLLGSTYKLRLGSRNSSTSRVGENLEYRRTDIYNPKELEVFMDGLDVVINCAGPSYRIRERVALAAAKYKVAYIDAFGGEPVQKAVCNLEGKFVIGAGSFPGLSGLLPLWLAKQHQLEQVDSFSMISMNHENSSFCAAADLILTSMEQFGKSGYYYRDGELTPVEHIKGEWMGFDDSSYYNEYINTETIQVAKQLKSKEAHWINVREENTQDESLKRIIGQYVQDKNYLNLEDALKRQVASEKKIENPFYQIACAITGERGVFCIESYACFRFTDSYSINAKILFETLKKILEEKENIPGIWAFEYLEPEIIRNCINTSSALVSIQTQVNQYEKIETGEI